MKDKFRTMEICKKKKLYCLFSIYIGIIIIINMSIICAKKMENMPLENHRAHMTN